MIAKHKKNSPGRAKRILAAFAAAAQCLLPAAAAASGGLSGDVTGDGRVTAEDARLVLRRAVNLESYRKDDRRFIACDVTADGQVTAEDARQILRIAVGLAKPYALPDVPRTPKGYEIQTINGVTYVGGVLIANKTYALPASYAPGDLTDETYAAFYRMQSDAWDLGLSLYISSGYRSYDLQNRLYNRYVSQDGKAAADRYSARPGHSEHQTGLAFDLNTITQSFAYTAEGRWVAKNCWRYGFILRYPEGKEDKTGYMYEPWHLRYLGKPLAEKVYESGLCLEEYLGITSRYP